MIRHIKKGVISILAFMVMGVSTASFFSLAAIQQLKPSEVKKDTTPSYTLTDEQQWKLYLYQSLIRAGFDLDDFLIMRKIAYCESSFRQYDKDGEVLKGFKHPHDLGLFQINIDVHKAEVMTPEGNIDYAIRLYKENGTRDWAWSKKCWNK